jgi:hypothetical protein
MAVMAAVIFTGSIAAQAADVTFGGQFRPRFEFWNIGSGSGVTGAPEVNPTDGRFINMRVRLNTKIKIDENTSGFIQFQSNTRFGSDLRTNVGAAPFSSSTVTNANDSRTDVGLHQAYFTLNKLFDGPLDMKLGRQEVVLDGHRLLGNTGWTQGAQSHDAIRVHHKHDNMTIAYVFSKVLEQSQHGLVGGLSQDDVDDMDVHVLWANWKGLENEGSSTSAYVILTDQDCNTAGVGSCTGGLALPGSQDFWTFGGRHAAGRGNLTYRGEFYYQAGKSGSAAVPADGSTGDAEAYMFGLRVGWKEVDIAMKPAITLWYDYLSGTSNGQANSGDNGTFNTLFDTGHKFYGYMDFFLATPVSGLHDAAIKFKVQPAAKTTLKMDIHNFTQATQSIGSNAGAKTLGQEIDLTAIYKYSASTKISAGYSHFFTREAMTAAADQDLQDRDWLYVMFDVKF